VNYDMLYLRMQTIRLNLLILYLSSAFSGGKFRLPLHSAGLVPTINLSNLFCKTNHTLSYEKIVTNNSNQFFVWTILNKCSFPMSASGELENVSFIETIETQRSLRLSSYITVNVIIHGEAVNYNSSEHDDIVHTLLSNQYSKRPLNIFILVMSTCDPEKFILFASKHNLFKRPIRLFVHFECLLTPDEEIFPNMIFIPNLSANTPVPMTLLPISTFSSTLSFYDVKSYAFTTHQLAKPILDWQAVGKRAPYPECLQTHWIPQVPNIHDQCHFHDILVNSLAYHLNFSFVQSSTSISLSGSSNPSGLLLTSVRITKPSDLNTGTASLLAKYDESFLYCDFKTLSERIPFDAIWSALHHIIWILIFLSLILSIIVLTLTDKLKQEKYVHDRISIPKSLSSQIAHQVLKVFRILLDQDLDLRSQSTIFILILSFNFMTVTNIYRNEITSKLIVRPPRVVLKDLVDLAKNGYRITYRNKYKTQEEREKRRRVNGRLFKLIMEMKNSAALFDNLKYGPMKSLGLNESEFANAIGNPKAKTAMYFTDNYYEPRGPGFLFTLKLHKPQYVCQLTEGEAMGFFYYAYFHSRISQEQKEMTELFRETGLLNLWKGLVVGVTELRNRNRASKVATLTGGDVRRKFIVISNLIPVFSIIGLALGLSIVLIVVKVIMVKRLNYMNNVNEFPDSRF